MTKNWIEEYRKADALWIHDGDPKKPHAILTAGGHSNGFFNSRKVTKIPYLLTDAAEHLVKNLHSAGCNLSSFDVVVGPQTGATVLAQHIAFEVGMTRKRICYSASPAEREEDGKRMMHLDGKDAATVLGRRALICDDVLTTGLSVTLGEDAIRAVGGDVHPDFVLALVNRTGQTTLNGRKVIALIQHEFTVWKPDDCPLCRQGSVALRPKDNWDELAGKIAA